jgi:quinol monooxygenase YgiN
MMEAQMSETGTDGKPVTQITFIECEPDKQAEALSLMSERARFMEGQPGFVSIDLHRSLDGRRIINVIKWRDRERLESAHKSPEFRRLWDSFGQMTRDIEPDLYEVALSLE